MAQIVLYEGLNLELKNLWLQGKLPDPFYQLFVRNPEYDIVEFHLMVHMFSDGIKYDYKYRATSKYQPLNFILYDVVSKMNERLGPMYGYLVDLWMPNMSVIVDDFAGTMSHAPRGKSIYDL